MGILIAFAARLAMRPKRFGLSGGSRDDQAARMQVCSTFEATNEPLNDPAFPPNYYAIDLMILAAFRRVIEGVQSSEGGASAGAVDPEQALEMHKQMYHRIGTRLLTSLNGAGALPFYPPNNTYGTPYRMRDDVGWARERAMLARGVVSESMRGGGGLGEHGSARGGPVPALAGPSEKRYALYRLLSEVQTWAHTGRFRGHQVTLPCRHVGRLAHRQPAADDRRRANGRDV